MSIEEKSDPPEKRSEPSPGDFGRTKLSQEAFAFDLQKSSRLTDAGKDKREELTKPENKNVSGDTPPGTTPTPDTKVDGDQAAIDAALTKDIFAAFTKVGMKPSPFGPGGDSFSADPNGTVVRTKGDSPPAGGVGTPPKDGPVMNMPKEAGSEEAIGAPPAGDKSGGKTVATADRANPGFDVAGKRLSTSTNINGVGKVDFSATRGKDNQVNSLEMKIGSDKYTLTKGEDGNWKMQPGQGQKTGDEKARKALESLGIKSDAKGNIGGQLDITSDGFVRYQNSDRPDRQVSYLGQDGTVFKLDFGDFTRTTTGPNGQKSVDAWNGKEFAPVAGDVKRSTNKDGSTTSSVTLKQGSTLKVERTTHPGDPKNGAGKRDETTIARRNADGTAGEVSQYNWLEGTKTTGNKTTYLDDTTGKYREGRKEGNTVNFTDNDLNSKAKSVTRDTASGTVTYKGPNGFELTKNLSNDRVTSSATTDGQFKFEYGAKSARDSSDITRLTIDGNKFTRVGPNRDTMNHEIAEGRKKLSDFQPKNNELNSYRDEKSGAIVKMSVAVGQDGTVKIAREGSRGGEDKAATQEFRPKGEPSPSRSEDLKKADADLTVKKDATLAPTEYKHASANLKLSKSEDGSWKAEALDGQKPFSKPTEFQKSVYTNNNLDASQKLRLVENSKKFDEMKNFTPQQKQEVYKQADRLLNGRQDSAIPANEKAGLADQLMWHVTNPGRNDQGYNNTCNTTVLRSLALKDKPEVVAKLAADVANDGQFKTSAGKDIQIPGDSVRARPGSPESTFPPKDGMRSALGKLWDISAINSVYQSESNGNHRFVEKPSEGRGDTGGRQLFRDQNGQEKTLYSRSNTNGSEKPFDNPGMSSTKIADAWNNLTGERLTGRFLSHDNRQMSHPDIVSGKFDSPEKLDAHLTANNNAGGKPLIVQGNTGKLDQIAKNLQQMPPGGEHVWIVSHYDAQTKTATIQNSWGKSNDIKMSVNDLYTALQTKSPNPLSDRTLVWKDARSSGSDKARRPNW